MRELNGVKIIGIDHGYGNIKSSCTVTPTGLFKYETEPVFSGNILEYNGTYYRVGEGHKEFIADKSKWRNATVRLKFRYARYTIKERGFTFSSPLFSL